MKLYTPHRWDLSYREALRVQEKLSPRVRLRPLRLGAIRYVAGADIALDKPSELGVAAVVVLTFPELEIIEEVTASAPLPFPYIPGMLSFREIPILALCLRKVRAPVDVLLCDGQGIAHPRRFGLASHIGVLLRRPTIGCAKSRLVGEHGAVGRRRGSFAPLVHEGDRVGSVLRTRDGVNPIFVSPGHLVDHASARRIALACAPRYRVPEPTRIADRLAGEEKRRL